MANKVRSQSFGNNVEILKLNEAYTGVPVMVKEAGGVTSGNLKIVPAGAILDIDGNVVNDETARFVLLSAVNVTYGDEVGTGLIHGFVDTTKIPTQPSAEAKAALRLVAFLTPDYDY